MKKFNKSTAIFFTIFVCVLLVAGFLFSFVPVKVGNKTFLSLSGTINYSSDIVGGMYGEYEITTENPSQKTLVSSMEKVKRVFEEYGYKNVNVYSMGSKLRVEMGYPRKNKTYAYAYSELSVVSGGAFFLSGAYEADATDTVVVSGSECVEKIEVFTNNATKYISIYFNKKGQEEYEKLCSATTSIYLHLGEYAQQISAENVTDFTSFTLSDNDYDNLISLEQRVVIGSMGIEINPDTATIETMSSNLVYGSNSPEEKGFYFGTVTIVMLSLLIGTLVLLLTLFAVKFGMFAILVAISMLFNSIFFVMLLNLMPSIEIGLSGVISLILGVSLIYSFTFIYASKVKDEYNLGKSFNASLSSAYKKNLPVVLITNIALLICAMIMFAFAFGELSSATIIFAICVALSLLTNLFLIPFFVKIAISFNKIGVKIFMLKKRKVGFGNFEEGEE